MKGSIEYCTMWGYESRAVSLAANVKQYFGLEMQLIKSSGGVFEIKLDGQLIYSKKQTGEFPEEMDVVNQISELRNKG